MTTPIDRVAHLRKAAEALEFEGGVLISPHEFRRRGYRVLLPDIPAEFAYGVPVVYVIQSGDFVKIGCTRNIHERVRTLMATNPHELKVVGLLPGKMPLERRLQARYAEHRHRDEWYHLRGALAVWVEQGCPFDEADDRL